MNLRFLLAGLLGLASCGPTYHVAIKPVAGNDRFGEGQEWAEARADSLYVRSTGSEIGPDWVEFTVSLYNQSQQPVVVYPERFFLDGARAPGAQPPASWRRAALEPETFARKQRAEAEKQEQRAGRVSVWEVMTVVGSASDELRSTRRRETCCEREAREARYQAEMAGYDQERATAASRASVAREQVKIAETALLRKTTLEPGQNVRGRVRFARPAQTWPVLRLTMPVAGRALTAEFAQRRIAYGSETAYLATGSGSSSPAALPKVVPPPLPTGK